MFDYDNAEPPVGLGNFLDWIWEAVEGYAYIVYSDPKIDRSWEQKRAEWPKKRDAVIDFILKQDQLGMNVYIAPALFDIQKYDTNPGYVKENVLGSNVYWSEYDGTAPPVRALEATETALTPMRDSGDGSTLEALSVADTPQGSKTEVPPPSLRVQSGHDRHEHHYWKSNNLITDMNMLEQVNRSITYATRADPSGWDCVQVLRPPYTRNHKYTDKPAVTVSYVADVAYTPESFSKVPAAKEVISKSIDVEALPTLESIIVKYAWTEEEYTAFSRDKVEEKTRSDSLMYLGYVGAEKGLTDSEIYTLVEDADRRWGKYVGRRDRKLRLLDIVNRARIKHPKSLEETTFAGLRGMIDTDGKSIEIIRGLWTFKTTKLTEPNWVIEGFLERQGVGLVASSPGVGKTQLTLQLAYSCALGTKFLRWSPVRPLRTLVFQLEMSEPSMHMFINTQLASYDEDFDKQVLLEQNCKIVQLGHSISIADADNRKFVEESIEKYQPDGIIFDSLGKLTNAKLDEEISRRISNFVDELKIKYGVFVWLIHHNRKSNSDNRRPTRLDDIFGSTYITANVSTAISLYQPTPQSRDIEVYFNKLRSAELPKPFIITRGEDLTFFEKGEIIAMFEDVGGEKNGRKGRTHLDTD